MFLAWPRTQMAEYSDGVNRCYCCLGSLPALPTWLGEPGKASVPQFPHQVLRENPTLCLTTN